MSGFHISRATIASIISISADTVISSPVAADFAFSLSPFARDLVDFLDAQGIDSAHFVMAEFASAVAIELAADFPARVRSLVLPGFG